MTVTGGLFAIRAQVGINKQNGTVWPSYTDEAGPRQPNKQTRTATESHTFVS